MSSDPSTCLLANTLQDLKSDFQSLARSESLLCIVLDPASIESAKQLLEQFPYTRLTGASWQNHPSGANDGPPRLAIVTCSERAVRREYGRIACIAGDLIQQFPASIKDAIASETLAQSGQNAWTFTVYNLARLQIPGAGLSVQRKYYVHHQPFYEFWELPDLAGASVRAIQAVLATLAEGTTALDHGELPANALTGNGHNPKPKQQKKSTQQGEGKTKLIAALTKHHQYADGGCLKLDPIGNNQLARLAKVDQATASVFFQRQFNGHAKYQAACADPARLSAALKMLNGEFAPHHLYGSKPPDEHERDEE